MGVSWPTMRCNNGSSKSTVKVAHEWHSFNAAVSLPCISCQWAGKPEIAQQYIASIPCLEKPWKAESEMALRRWVVHKGSGGMLKPLQKTLGASSLKATNASDWADTQWRVGLWQIHPALAIDCQHTERQVKVVACVQ